MKITNPLPAGVNLYGKNGNLLPVVNGEILLSPADVDALEILPPLHWSSPKQGDLNLESVITVNDTAIGQTSLRNTTFNMSIAVRGVADKPNSEAIDIDAVEDEKYSFGPAFAGASGVLVDVSTFNSNRRPNLRSLDTNEFCLQTDGSESLYYVLAGLPKGIIPESQGGKIHYIGSGKWQISELAAQTLLLTPVKHYSGESPYPALTVWATSQEMDGDQATSNLWSISARVQPRVDGFSSWSASRYTATEKSIESGTALSLAGANSHVLKDQDGSETVRYYTFDLSTLLVDAGISERLKQLEGNGAGINEFVSNYVSGSFSWNQSAAVMTVLASDINSVAFKPTVFQDSNQDFSIPITALVRDKATIQGSDVIDEKVESGTFDFDLVGTADVPTAFATSTSGQAFSSLPVTLGGSSTDTDAALGRDPSEDVYYVVKSIDSALLYSFVQGDGTVVGMRGNNGYWVLTPSDISNLHVFVRSYSNASNLVAGFNTTTVARENDGDMAWASVKFNVTLSSPTVQPGTEPLPLPPILQIGGAGEEDAAEGTRLNGTAVPDPNDATSPTVSIVFWNLPAKAEIRGAKLNPYTNEWSASAAALASGLLSIVAPPDMAGMLAVSARAVAATSRGLQASSSNTTVSLFAAPVADGTSISVSPSSSREDQLIVLVVNATEIDVDGSETLGEFAYVRANNGATILNGTTVASSDSDATIAGTSFVGARRVPASALRGLQILPRQNWHGDITVDISIVVTDSLNSTQTSAIVSQL